MMELRQSPFAQRLSQMLIRERIAYYEQVKRRASKSPVDPRESSVRDLRFFQRKEAKLSRRPHVLVLHHLFTALSPYYAALFSHARSLGVKLNPVFQSQTRQNLEWNPFEEGVPVPANGTELELLLKQPLDVFTITDTFDMIGLNTNAMHEVLHALFMRLIPPPQRAKDLRNYFLFIEALVFTSERYTSVQLGKALADAFVRLRLLSMSYSDDSTIQLAQGDPEKVFMITFGNHLTTLHGWSRERRGKLLPAHAQFVTSRNRDRQEISKVFVERVSPTWLKYFEGSRYPARWRKVRSKHPNLLLSDFSVVALLEKERMQEIHRWHRDLFRINPAARIETSA